MRYNASPWAREYLTAADLDEIWATPATEGRAYLSAVTRHRWFRAVIRGHAAEASTPIAAFRAALAAATEVPA